MIYSKEKQLKSNRKKIQRNFTQKTIKEIFERDNYECVRCSRSWGLESVPHHIIFKSQGGTGEKRNGATVCLECHRLAHSKRDIRLWFEQWRDENLDEVGNLIEMGYLYVGKKGTNRTD